jgi:flavin-dependent dehydrogenase
MTRSDVEAEEVFTAARTGAMLNLGGAMLRRYATTYEALSGQEITINKREGRLFTQEQVDTLLKARDLVTTQGLSVRAAMQIALSGDLHPALRGAERASQALQWGEVGKDARAFAEAVRDAVQDGNKELVEEMRLLRARLESNSNLEHNVRTPALQERPDKHGPFVRFALWVEGLFGK